MSRGRGSGGGRRALHLAEVVLQLQLAALGLALHHVPALVELLQAALQPLHAVPQAGEQQALPGLVDGLHGAGMGHHVVPQHLGTARGRQGQHLAPRWAPGPPPHPLQRCHHGTGTGERPGKGRPEQGLLSSKWHRAAARQQICCFVEGGLLGWGMDEAGATLPCMAPPQPTCTSQHPADGRHGTSVPGQGKETAHSFHAVTAGGDAFSRRPPRTTDLPGQATIAPGLDALRWAGQCQEPGGAVPCGTTRPRSRRTSRGTALCNGTPRQGCARSP